MNFRWLYGVMMGSLGLLGGGCAHEPSPQAVKPGTWGQENRAWYGSSPAAASKPAVSTPPKPVSISPRVETSTPAPTSTDTSEARRPYLRAGNADRAASQLKPTVPAIGASTNDMAKAGPVVRLGSDIRGQIQTVNQTARYVVLRFPLGVMPSKNSFLDVVRGGVKVGEVRVTGPQKDNLTVADILVGGFEVGDEVRAQALP